MICIISDSEIVYAAVRGDFVYFGVAADGGGELQCNYAESIYTAFLEFPLGGDYTYNNGILECPTWALTVKRTLENSIIGLIANGKYYVTNEAAALSRGAYVSSAGRVIANDLEYFFLYYQEILTFPTYNNTKHN